MSCAYVSFYLRCCFVRERFSYWEPSTVASAISSKSVPFGIIVVSVRIITTTITITTTTTITTITIPTSSISVAATTGATTATDYYH